MCKEIVKKEGKRTTILDKIFGTIMAVGNITKGATFLVSFLHLSFKNAQLLFFMTVLFNIFMKQTLTDDF